MPLYTSKSKCKIKRKKLKQNLLYDYNWLQLWWEKSTQSPTTTFVKRLSKYGSSAVDSKGACHTQAFCVENESEKKKKKEKNPNVTHEIHRIRVRSPGERVPFIGISKCNEIMYVHRLMESKHFRTCETYCFVVCLPFLGDCFFFLHFCRLFLFVHILNI